MVKSRITRVPYTYFEVMEVIKKNNNVPFKSNIDVMEHLFKGLMKNPKNLRVVNSNSRKRKRSEYEIDITEFKILE